MKYRSDIDGLRAIAVLSIVLYHFGAQTLSGGFVGVDIFFVISGFLITQLIANDIEADTFKLSDFFLRRVRRLAPALLVTISVTLFVGYFMLVPTHFDALGSSAVATLFSVSNILFWSVAGYFDTAAIYKPLLHTWSLGVEEQFYFIWPATLMLLWARWSRKGVMIAIGIAAVVSLLGAIWAAQDHPEAGFFLTPFRIYEFAFGAILALWRRPVPNTLTSNLAAIVGLTLITYAVLRFNSQMAFPGAAALVPCFGTALLIFGGERSFVGNFLSLPPLRYVGKISYSLYLVHWPVVVFYAYVNGRPDSWPETGLLFAISFILAVEMYRLIETPFRARNDDRYLVSSKKFGAGAVSIVVVLCIIGLHTDRVGVHEARQSPEIAQLVVEMQQGNRLRRIESRRETCFYNNDHKEGFEDRFEACHEGLDEDVIVILGDSHSSDIYIALRRLYPDLNIMQISGAGCDFSKASATRRCAALFGPAMTWLEQNTDIIKAVIYSQRGGRLLKDDQNPSAGFDPDGFNLVTSILPLYVPEELPLYFWGPRMEYFPVMRVVLPQHETRAQVSAFYHQTSTDVFRSIDDQLAAALPETIPYFSTMKAMCNPDCPIFTPSGGILFLDSAHWHPTAGEYAVATMLDTYPELKALFEP